MQADVAFLGNPQQAILGEERLQKVAVAEAGGDAEDEGQHNWLKRAEESALSWGFISIFSSLFATAYVPAPDSWGWEKASQGRWNPGL